MRVLITGVTGQDGSYLAEQLAAGGHEVWGLVRGQANPKLEWLQKLVPGLHVAGGDILDQSSLQQALLDARPDVVFHLAACTFVGMAWAQPMIMSETTGMGTLRMLEAIRHVNPEIRFVQASSSEMFGEVITWPQDEGTRFNPRSPYGVAKCFAHYATVNYRESYGMHASCAIMFNHESPRRGTEFVTRKVTRGAARIAAGLDRHLPLGNLEAIRDWGYAPDYTRGLQAIAAQETPGDYVLATGIARSVRELARTAFAELDLDWAKYVTSDPALLRPNEVDRLLGRSMKASDVLGWEPSVSFGDMIAGMVAHDLQEATREASTA